MMCNRPIRNLSNSKWSFTWSAGKNYSFHKLMAMRQWGKGLFLQPVGGTATDISCGRVFLVQQVDAARTVPLELEKIR